MGITLEDRDHNNHKENYGQNDNRELEQVLGAAVQQHSVYGQVVVVVGIVVVVLIDYHHICATPLPTGAFSDATLALLGGLAFAVGL